MTRDPFTVETLCMAVIGVLALALVFFTCPNGVTQ